MRRSWLIAAIILGVAAIAAVALIMRLTENGTGQPSATAWADSVCASLATWRSAITSLADVGGGSLTPESLADKLDEAAGATQALADDLKSLGPPDLESGADLERQLDSAATEIEASFDTLKQGAEAATEASSPAGFIQALAALAPQFQALLDTISTTVDDLRNANVAEASKAELERAFSDAASCRQLQADS